MEDDSKRLGTQGKADEPTQSPKIAQVPIDISLVNETFPGLENSGLENVRQDHEAFAGQLRRKSCKILLMLFFLLLLISVPQILRFLTRYLFK